MDRPQSQSPMQASTFSQLTIAGASAWGAHALYGLNLRGVDLAGYGALLLGLLAFVSLVNAMSARHDRQRRTWAKKQLKKVTKVDGRSRWGTPAETKKAGMADAGGHFLGAHEGRLRYHTGEGSALVVAKPGSGKFTSSLAPNLLKAHTDAAGRAASLVVLDLKLEAFATTHRRMLELGYHVECLCPWSDLMSRALGIDIEDAGYNPMLPLLTAGDGAKDLAEQLAALLLPIAPRSSGSSEFFTQSGRLLLVFAMLWLLREQDPARLNLVEIRRLLMSKPEDLEDALARGSVSLNPRTSPTRRWPSRRQVSRHSTSSTQ